MPDRDEVMRLAERVEAATGPDRLLDALIGAAVRAGPMGQVAPSWLQNWAGEFGPMPKITGNIAALHSNGEPGVHWAANDYTASLDAAMTLVPEGFWAEIGIRGTYGTAQLSGHLEEETYSEFASAATPALALTAAALRALAKGQDNG